MDLTEELPKLNDDSESKIFCNTKRSHPEYSNNSATCDTKKPKLEEQPRHTSTTNDECDPPKVIQNPKQRIELVTSSPKKEKKKFIYGNYSQYYGYRNSNTKNNNNNNNKSSDVKDNHDVRLDMLEARPQLFNDKQVLDIGCNSGWITMELAKRFTLRRIVGVDIDRSLINRANKHLLALKKSQPLNNPNRKAWRYPYNVSFIHGNYVLKDDVLLEIERPQFDIIMCLSLTKWIQLNFGDAGLKQAFRRMFLQLRSGGKLILEAQPYDNYGRRKQLTEETRANFLAMKFFPADFEAYLLSSEVGFASVELLGIPDHVAAGFKRPIKIFTKN